MKSICFENINSILPIGIDFRIAMIGDLSLVRRWAQDINGSTFSFLAGKFFLQTMKIVRLGDPRLFELLFYLFAWSAFRLGETLLRSSKYYLGCDDGPVSIARRVRHVVEKHFTAQL